MLYLIVAYSKNRCIGAKGQIPWRLKSDMQRVKELTTGNAIIMGRKTFESIGKALPNRQNIVLTSDKAFAAPDITVAHSLDEALAKVEEGKKPFIFGGAGIYKEALPRVDKIYATEVDCEIEGDAFFSEVKESEWQESSRERHQSDETNQYNYCFVEYERK